MQLRVRYYFNNSAYWIVWRIYNSIKNNSDAQELLSRVLKHLEGQYIREEKNEEWLEAERNGEIT